MERGEVKRVRGPAVLLLIAAGAATSSAHDREHRVAPPARGSAPTILANLMPAIVALGGGAVTLEAPFGPPQGRRDPKLADFLTGRRSFAFLTRAAAEADLATFRAHHAGRSPLVLPIAAGSWNRFGYVDAVVFVVHPTNPVRSLTRAQLALVFAATQRRGGPPVRRWRDLGIAGAAGDLPVRIVGGGSWTGAESARALTVRHRIFGRDDRWRAAPDSGDDGNVVARVARDPAAIGFTGMGQVAGVRPIAIDGTALSAASARDGRYPLLRTVDLLFDVRGSAIDARVHGLAAAMLSAAGQRTVARQGDFAALPPPMLAASRRMLARLRPRPVGVAAHASATLPPRVAPARR